MKYSTIIYESFDEETLDLNRPPFEERLFKIAEGAIPNSIDRTENGEFVIDDTVYGEEGYFFNEDCYIDFYTRNGEVKAFYYADGRGEYHFDINVNEDMSDDEIKLELIKGFSKKFGWVENFEVDGEKLEGVDSKFWASLYYEGERKLIEVDRELFQANIDVYNEMGDWTEEGYNNLVEIAVKAAKKHFPKINTEEAFAEFYNLTEEESMECAFISIGIVDGEMEDPREK